MLFPEPLAGLAGMLPGPFGHVDPEEPRRVSLWLLIPLTPEERTPFGGTLKAHSRWITERENQCDLHRYEQGWDTV